MHQPKFIAHRCIKSATTWIPTSSHYLYNWQTSQKCIERIYLSYSLVHIKAGALERLLFGIAFLAKQSHIHKHLTFISLAAFTFQLVHCLSALLRKMSESVPANKKIPTFFLGKIYLLLRISYFSCAGWIWTRMMLHYKLRNSQRMSRLTLGTMSCLRWLKGKKKSCKMYVLLCFLYISLIEISVSFTANSVVKNSFFFYKNNRNLSFAISPIHLDDHWKWQEKS